MTSSFKWAVARIILTTLYLFAGWMLFTGSTNLRSLLMGGGFSFLIALTTFKLFIDDDEAARRTLLPGSTGCCSILYWCSTSCTPPVLRPLSQCCGAHIIPGWSIFGPVLTPISPEA